MYQLIDIGKRLYLTTFVDLLNYIVVSFIDTQSVIITFHDITSPSTRILQINGNNILCTNINTNTYVIPNIANQFLLSTSNAYIIVCGQYAILLNSSNYNIDNNDLI